MAKAKKKEALSLEEKLELALVTIDEQQYEVPENWCWVEIESLVEICLGLTHTPTYVDAGVPFLSVKDITGGCIDFTNTKFITEEEYNSLPYGAKPRRGDILFARVGTIGAPQIVETDKEFGTFVSLGFFRPKSELINRKYIAYWIKSILFEKQVSENVKGSTLKNLNTGWLRHFQIPLPPESEQQRIVEQIESLFAKLDEAKEQVQSVLDNSEERKSAILFKAYSGALTKGWRKQNGKCQDEWQKVRLKDVCKINPPKINAKDYDDDMEVSFFPMPALSEITGTITEPQTRKLGEVKTGFTNFSEGDVVFAKITPCMENGKSAIIGKLVNDIGYGTTEFYVMRCSNKLSNGYLYHLVRSKHFRDEAKSVMTGAVGQQRVPKSFLEEYELKLPPIEEQEEILKIVDAMVNKEHQVAVNCENVIEQIDMMKKSILARAFRGELGTNNLEEESAVELLKQMLNKNM